MRPVQKTGLVEIRVFSEEPKEAARLANAVTASYVAYAASHSEALRVQVVDTAYPNIRPVRPNKPLNIILGVVIGIVVGLVCGFLTYWLTLVFQRRKVAMC